MAGKKVYPRLPRAEVVKAVERKNPSRVPLSFAKWWGEGLHEQYGQRLSEFDRFPDDTVWVGVYPIDIGRMNLSWKVEGGKAIDSNLVISDWSQLDEFIDKLPLTAAEANDEAYETMAVHAANLRKQDVYIHFGWWNFFFERPWGLRGMENLMLDYHLYPEQIHRLHDAMADVYIGHIRRAARDFAPDGFWTSDDLGHQTGLMMGPEIFRDLIKPYYAKVGKALKESRMHWWLHSCGDNTEIMGDLADAGVDVFHPIQKHTMDEVKMARQYGDRMTFLAGFDVQHTLQEATPEGVRQEVRFLIDTFDRPEGGFLLAAGNGIVRGTPFENIEAFLEEALEYGTAHRKAIGKGK